MAEAAVKFVVEKLGGLIAEEALLLFGVRDQVEWLEDELRRMQCFLKDADHKRRRGDERVKNWVREVIEIAFRAEDVIDTFMLKARQRQPGFIKRYALIPSKLLSSHKVAKEIGNIRIKIHEISESRVTYGIANLDEIGGADQGGNEILDARRNVFPVLNDGDDDIVGFHVYSEMVVRQLLDTNRKRRCVVSIVGMGGLGKTTLAQKVYNDRQVLTGFPTRIWVTVSADFKLLECLHTISRKAMGISTSDLQGMHVDEVKEKLHGFLKERVYLIVVDDIWRTDVWRQLDQVLPDSSNGSRVLFTTRSEEVARCAGSDIPPIMLKVLDDGESWELFTKKVFLSSSCPEELKELGLQMMKRCRGLPLALVVLGGLLSRKPLFPHVWLQVAESMNWESTDDGRQCLKILALSYNALPNHYLKSCFLYMGCFPEDSIIKVSRLVRLWIAEGFIAQRDAETMEDTALGYMEELVQRSMVQVVRRKYDGRIFQCRMHDLMLSMCITEARQDGFLNVVSNGTTHEIGSNNVAYNTPSSRRLALHNTNCIPEDVPHNLRTLLCQQPRHSYSEVLPLPHGLKLLRVLVHNDVLPEQISSMTHLRYLEASSSRANLPPCIGKLCCLQTLDLRKYYGQQYPKDWGQLVNLRHLYLRRLYCCPPRIATMPNLQTLKNVHCDEQWVKRDLPWLTNLRRLSILEYRGDGNALADSIRNLNQLTSFKLKKAEKLSVEPIITALAQNSHLHKLYLAGPTKLPSKSDVFPPNLAKLILKFCDLEQDPMPILEKLPNLILLEWRSNASRCREIVCSTGGFPRLQELELELLYAENWVVETGAFPNLTKLSIDTCKFAMLPIGLEHVTSLKRLVVWVERQELIDKLRGEEWYKIKHVPSIEIKLQIMAMPFHN